MSFKEKINKMFGGKYKRHLILLAFDFFCFAGIMLVIWLLHQLLPLAPPTPKKYISGMAVLFAYILVLRTLFGVYSNVWRYTSTKAYFHLLLSDLCAWAFAEVTIYLLGLLISVNLPSSLYIDVLMVSLLTLFIALLSRVIYAILYERMPGSAEPKVKLPVAIVGAGRLGTYLAGDLLNNKNSDYKPLFFIDRDAAKIGKTVAGLKVYSLLDARELINKNGVSTVIIAITKSTQDSLTELYDEYTNLHCKVRIYESLISEDEDDRKRTPTLRNFTIEDLLFRKPREINDKKSLSFYNSKVVLVTGGGGSIGSELCRQIAKCSPAKLIIMDIYENNAYDIQQELSRKYGDKLDFCVEIGSVRDRKRLEDIFSHYRPDIIFHAAAHKHVPLMESSAGEAIKNNVIGTYNTADMAEKYGADKFILISTDKAVNPTSIMGATKRLCEMVIQCRTDSKTSFAAVRFGNVLGSNGSVIPLFKKQIEEGGPVTITDRRIIRYFMTITEAAQLVIESGAMARSGDLFVLDMGSPVKIFDLARNMIKLMGLVPGVDIKIKEVGLRPGEKLYEELLMKNENLDKTDNKLIFIEHDTPYSRKEVDEKLRILSDAVDGLTGIECSAIKKAIIKVVPTFHSAEELNKTAETSEEMQMVNGENHGDKNVAEDMSGT